jgi:hypothetical protein
MVQTGHAAAAATVMAAAAASDGEWLGWPLLKCGWIWGEKIRRELIPLWFRAISRIFKIQWRFRGGHEADFVPFPRRWEDLCSYINSDFEKKLTRMPINQFETRKLCYNVTWVVSNYKSFYFFNIKFHYTF